MVLNLLLSSVNRRNDLPPISDSDETSSTTTNYSIVCSSTKDNSNTLNNIRNNTTLKGIVIGEKQNKKAYTYTTNVLFVRTPYKDEYVINNNYLLRVRNSEKRQTTLIAAGKSYFGNFALFIDKIQTDSLGNRLWIEWKSHSDVIMMWDFINSETVDVRILDSDGMDMTPVLPGMDLTPANQVTVYLDIRPNLLTNC